MQKNQAFSSFYSRNIVDLKIFKFLLSESILAISQKQDFLKNKFV